MNKLFISLILLVACDVVFAETPIVYSRCLATTDSYTETRTVTLTPEAGGGTLEVTKTFTGLESMDVTPDVKNFFEDFTAPCDLVYRDANGSETVIHDCSTNGNVVGQPTCAAMDAAVSFDGTKITYALFVGNLVNYVWFQPNDITFHPDAVSNTQGNRVLPVKRIDSTGAHLRTYNLTTSTSLDLTPFVSGRYDSGPSYIPKNRVAFTSTREGNKANIVFKGGNPIDVTTLWSIGEDGKNVRQDSFHARSQEQHPFMLKDGRLAYTSWQTGALTVFRKSQGTPGSSDTVHNYFMIWAQRPDGSLPFPLFGQHKKSTHLINGLGEDLNALHFMTQMSDGKVATANYYRENNGGLGVISLFTPEPFGREGSNIEDHNPGDIFMPSGLVNFAPWSSNADTSADVINGFPQTPYYHPNYTSRLPWYGKVGYPFSLPGNVLGLSWGVGGCSSVASNVALVAVAGSSPPLTFGKGAYINMMTELKKAMVDAGYGDDIPACNLGIYKSTVIPSVSPSDLQVIVDRKEYHEILARAVVPYSAIHGVSEPDDLSRPLGPLLPAGTPYALLGAASITDRETRPKTGNSYNPNDASKLQSEMGQGFETVFFDDEDMCGVRIIGIHPNVGNNTYNDVVNVFGERHVILGELYTKNKNQQGNDIIDPSGHPDTSFLVKMPANMTYTMAGIDCDGRVLNLDQTWQSLKPGEQKVCGGCHVHSRPTRINFSQSHAATPGYVPFELGKGTVPLLNGLDGSGNIIIRTETGYGYTVDFNRDIKPIFQSRCNSCHGGSTPAAGLALDIYPTGNTVSTDNRQAGSTWYRLVYDNTQTYVPVALQLKNTSGVKYNLNKPWLSKYIKGLNALGSLLYWKAANARTDKLTDNTYTTDIDFGAAHPTTITKTELGTLARWIELGSPGGSLELLDTHKPSVNIVATKSNDTITALKIGVTDLGSGINVSSASLTVNGTSVPISIINDDVTDVPLSPPISNPNAEIVFSVSDSEGNTQTETLTAQYFLQTVQAAPIYTLIPLYNSSGVQTGQIRVTLKNSGTQTVVDSLGRDTGQRVGIEVQANE